MIRVMVVDDAAFMRLSIRTILEQHGFEIVAEAANGIEAIAKYLEVKPDVVTMDITMPEMGGIEAVEKICAIDKKARIVMVSAMGQESIVIDAVKVGAKSFIVKPFKADRVIEVLTQVAPK